MSLKWLLTKMILAVLAYLVIYGSIIIGFVLLCAWLIKHFIL